MKGRSVPQRITREVDLAGRPVEVEAAPPHPWERDPNEPLPGKVRGFDDVPEPPKKPMEIGGGHSDSPVRWVRDNLRMLIAGILAGRPPVLILRDAGIPAVMVAAQEIERWRRIEQGLWVLHTLKIYPEISLGSFESEAMFGGRYLPSSEQIQEVESRPRDILGPTVTIGLAEARTRFASLLDEVEQGRVVTIVFQGRMAVTLIRIQEYDRLRDLVRRIWGLQADQLDLAEADTESIREFVREFRLIGMGALYGPKVVALEGIDEPLDPGLDPEDTAGA
jgi:prevent-host-death family protein